MSKTIAVWSWRQAITRSGLPATTRHVLLTLSLYMNEHGEGCFPSMQRLADDTGLSKRSVINQIQKARELEWISVIKHGYGDQRWRRFEYVPKFPSNFSLKQSGSIQNCEQEGGEGDSPASEEVVKDVHQLTEKGGERRSPRNCEGGEPNDKKVVNDVHPNNPTNHPPSLARDENDELEEEGEDRNAQIEFVMNAFWAAREKKFGIRPPTSISQVDWFKTCHYLNQPGATQENLASIIRSAVSTMKQAPNHIGYFEKIIDRELAKVKTQAPRAATRTDPVCRVENEAVRDWFTSFCNELRGRFGPAIFNSWIAQMELVEFVFDPLRGPHQSATKIVFTVPSRFHLEWVNTHYRHWINHYCKSCDVELKVSSP